MVQGNLLALSISHLIIASQTGVFAGLIAGLTILFARISRPWIISVVVGTITAAVDYITHPGMFGGIFTEAIVTGFAAGCMSFIFSMLIKYVRKLKGTKLKETG